MFFASDEDVVGDGVPGVVDGDEEQEECDGGDDEHGRAGVPVRQNGGGGQEGVGEEGENSMEHPVFEDGVVRGLRAHAAGDYESIDDAAESDEAPECGDDLDAFPGGAQDGREQEHDAEMDDVGGAEGLAGLGIAAGRGDVGDEGHDDKLQADQSAGGGAGDDVKVLPAVEGGHGVGWLHGAYLKRSYFVADVKGYAQFGVVDSTGQRGPGEWVGLKGCIL